MKKYLIFIIFVIFTTFLIALSCAQPGGGGGGGGSKGGGKKEPAPIAGYIFTGGTEVKTFGFIDVNDNGVLDDGDPVAELNYITINGNQTSTFIFPDDFEIPTTPPNSGSISVNLLGAGAYDGETFYIGSLAFLVYPPTSNNAIINAGTIPTLPLQLDGVTQIFYGGADVPAGAYIDVDGNGIMNDGDLCAGSDITINGDRIIDLELDPVFFAPVENSGSISVNLSDADAFNGKKFYCGAIYSQGYPVANNNAVINSGTIPTLPLQLDGVTQIFMNGAEVYVGGFIDVNGNGISDNGDYAGGTGGPITIGAGVNAVNLDASLFGVVSNSGFISVNLQFTDSYDILKGKKFYYGTFHVNGYKAIANNAVINSTNMNLVIK